jgi:hypothetical protein
MLRAALRSWLTLSWTAATALSGCVVDEGVEVESPPSEAQNGANTANTAEDGQGGAEDPDAGARVLRRCDDVLEAPWQASDDRVLTCGAEEGLGPCRVQGGCQTCACEHYVKVAGLCDSVVSCDYPLNGTGCSSGYYAGDHDGVLWDCPGDSRTQAACMLRRLIEWGYCDDDPMHPPAPERPADDQAFDENG